MRREKRRTLGGADRKSYRAYQRCINFGQTSSYYAHHYAAFFAWRPFTREAAFEVVFAAFAAVFLVAGELLVAVSAANPNMAPTSAVARTTVVRIYALVYQS